MKPELDRAYAVAGISVFLGLATGIASLVVALVAFLSMNWMATGVCLGAAGLAFGLVANAVLRH